MWETLSTKFVNSSIPGLPGCISGSLSRSRCHWWIDPVQSLQGPLPSFSTYSAQWTQSLNGDTVWECLSLFGVAKERTPLVITQARLHVLACPLPEIPIGLLPPPILFSFTDPIDVRFDIGCLHARLTIHRQRCGPGVSIDSMEPEVLTLGGRSCKNRCYPVIWPVHSIR